MWKHWTHTGLVQRENSGIDTGTEFYPIKTSPAFCCPEKVRHINKRFWDLVCTCTRFFCKRVFNAWKLFNLKCRKGMYLFNYFKLITVCFPHPFFHSKYIAQKLVFCGQNCYAALFFKKFFISNEIIAFSYIEKFVSFGSISCFGLQRHGIRVSSGYLQNILIFCQFFPAAQ